MVCECDSEWMEWRGLICHQFLMGHQSSRLTLWHSIHSQRSVPWIDRSTCCIRISIQTWKQDSVITCFSNLSHIRPMRIWYLSFRLLLLFPVTYIQDPVNHMAQMLWIIFNEFLFELYQLVCFTYLLCWWFFFRFRHLVISARVPISNTHWRWLIVLPHWDAVWPTLGGCSFMSVQHLRSYQERY